MTDNSASNDSPPQALTRKQLREAALAASQASDQGDKTEQVPSQISATESNNSPAAEDTGWDHIVNTTGAVELTPESSSVASSKPLAKKRKRPGGCLLAVLIMVLVLALVVWGIFAFGPKIKDALGWGELDDWESSQAHGEVSFVVNDGDTLCGLSPKLFEAGVTKSETVVCDYLLREGLNPTLIPGSYLLQLQMSAPAVVEVLTDESNIVQSNVILPEGLTAQQTIVRLAEGTGIPLADFEAAIADPAVYGIKSGSVEGWLFPSSYQIAPELSAVEIIQLMVTRTEEALDRAGVLLADRAEVLTIASIIQREGTSISDFTMISRVIQNRLAPENTETGGRLEMDSTVQFGYGEMHNGSVSTSAAARNDDNPWNTYMYPGLPAGPIANPGQDAIDAAVNPEPGPWMYFVTVNLASGETVFSATFAEHERAVARWQAWCVENPDQGC